jgi:hypothetical protein
MTGPALAWVYPEHRDISVLAVKTLDPERKELLERLWEDARSGDEARLCVEVAEPGQGLKPDCIDWAAMAAIAGDHSCSSSEMLDTVIHAQWILHVANVAAQLKVDLSQISAAAPVSGSADQRAIDVLRRRLESERVRAQRLNALRVADVQLQRADPQYAIRAESNNAHFLLARPTSDFTAEDYLRTTLTPGSSISAVGVFGLYHLSALQKATRLARETLSPQERSALTRALLADEAFALHFLEDVFAAGHVAGTRGDVSQRKGSHDYYNEHGLEVTTWQSGLKIVLLGDAHMRTEDAERAAAAVRSSLEQLVDVAANRPGKNRLKYVPEAPDQPDALDICHSTQLGERPNALIATPEAYQLGVAIVLQMPVPGLGPGVGELPRFRAEIGPFIGAAGSLDLRYLDGGFTGLEDGRGFIGGADLSLRAGYGLEGVLGDAGDGLIYFSLGYRGDTPSSNKFDSTAAAEQAGSLAAAVPARSGFSARLRMPYYLIPGDLLLLSPMYFMAPNTYRDMAVRGVNGGLIPWELGWATPFGRFQFVLGREFGVAFYGVQENGSLLAPGAMPGAGSRVIRFKSNYFDFPILEYRAFRAFDVSQTSELVLQLYFGVDVPEGGNAVVPPGAPGVELERVYSIGVRTVFDWRHYLGNGQ